MGLIITIAQLFENYGNLKYETQIGYITSFCIFYCSFMVFIIT